MRFIPISCIFFTTSLLCSSSLNASNDKIGKYLDKEIPENWSYTEYFSQDIPTDDYWWKTFEDSCLDSLIAEGIANNYNVLTAAHRINMAAQAVNSARAGYLPSVGLNAGWQKSRSSGRLGPRINGCDYIRLFFTRPQYELGDRCLW